MSKAIYPGTFDPITRGHEDLVRRAVIQQLMCQGEVSAADHAARFLRVQRLFDAL